MAQHAGGGGGLPDAAPAGGAEWNFGVLLLQGTFFDAAKYLASPRLVLPFLYMAFGAPTFLAGVLTPLVQFAQLVSQIVGAPVVQTARTRKWHVMLCGVAMGSALSMLGLPSADTSGTLVAAVFLFVALALGLIRGLNNLAYTDLLGRSMSQASRSSLIFTQSSIAGAVAIAATWGAHRLWAGATPLRDHVNLLWTGAAITVLAGVVIVLIREAPAGGGDAASPRGRSRYIAELREGLGRVAHVDWFGRYVVARALLVSVELAMPFYAIHGATIHAGTSGSLSAFVIASSAAVIVGGPVWRRLGRVSKRLVMAAGAAVAALAGAWALVIDATPALQQVGPHAVVFALVAAGTQGVVGARTVYLLDIAPAADRPYYIAVGNTISGALGVVVALVFGAIAHIQGAAWPVLLIVALNVLACLACLRLKGIPKPVGPG